jgi:hypothetical protein
MSEDFVRDVLREHAEGDMPPVKDPWPAIRDKVQASHSAQQVVSSYEPLPARPEAERITAIRGRSRLRVSMAMAMIGLLALAAGSIAFLAWNGPQRVADNSLVPGCWGFVSSPNVEGGDSALSALSASSANDVWAVGYSSSAGVAQTLVQRWNGQQWAIIPSANVPSRNNYLTSVAALAANNVWAAGYHCTGDCANANGETPLVQHWDGTQWSIISVPGNGRLDAIATLSANDIWAVGNAGRFALTVHWNGQQWSQVPTSLPLNEYTYFSLKSAVAISPSDVWAIGYENDTYIHSRNGLFLHWDGIRWSYLFNTGGPVDARLYGAAAASANDIWAVGEKGDDPFAHDPLQTVTKHWDGADWNEVPSPNVGTGDSYLRGVTAISPTDAWAVGGYGPRTGTKQTLILHWDGAAWSVVPSPNVEGQSNRFFSIEAISANDLWAVGTYNSASTGTLVERYNNPCTVATPTESPAATNTPAPTASSTPCTPGSFSDVLPGSTFHPFVQCLVERGIISGYADCTFRPNNEVTRGQLSKIVSNAAGFTEAPGTQRFEDVPPTNTFYEWIQRLAARGHISGYECGGVGEPCISGKPYFRPNSNATRGQISKIVSNAAQFGDPPGEQIFEDVPPTHTFYEWIQRLASRNIMSGYPCGGPGEPCETGNLPYFRPQNNATRGQTSKIVANTFFPECNSQAKP